MLPDDCDWQIDDRYDHHWLRCNGQIVALVSQTIHGKWIVTINRHRWRSGPTGPAGSLALGKRMAERWATVHAGRLRREAFDDRIRNPPKGDPKLSRAEQRMERH
jgi:hypothetical protein